MEIGSDSILRIALAVVLVAGAIPAHASKKISLSDETFLNDALRWAKVEAQLGQMAASKTADPDLKDFARQTARDDSIISRQLERIAQNENLSVRKVTGKDQNELNKLSKLKGFGFDQAYLRYEIENLGNDLGYYHNETRHGSSPDLKRFAVDTAPELEARMKTANRIEEEQLLELFLIDP